MKDVRNLSRKVIISNVNLGKNINKMLKIKVNQEFLNKVIPDTGIIDSINEINLLDPLGEIVNKGVKFNIVISCSIYYLKLNEHIKGKINNITNIGIFVHDCENTLANIFIPSEDNESFIVGQYINIKVEAVRINDVEITAIGSII